VGILVLALFNMIQINLMFTICAHACGQIPDPRIIQPDPEDIFIFSKEW